MPRRSKYSEPVGPRNGASSPLFVDLAILERCVRVHCPDDRFEAWIRELYRSMLRPEALDSPPHLEYHIEPDTDADGFRVQEADGHGIFAQTAGESLALLEDSLTIALQLFRPDLLFVHAAALADEHGGIALVGASGAGKSTLAWALTALGFTYLSDELAPFDVNDARVIPFPRAIHLKNEPPGAAPLPPTTVNTGRSLCVPTASLHGGVAGSSQRVHALFFLAAEQRAEEPSVREITPGDAASRLFLNALNAAAHASFGVDAVVRIARQAKCYELVSSDLDATGELIRSVLRQTLEG